MNRYRIRSRIWIESGDKVLLGEGRVILLKAIDEHGSLSQAAKSIHMSYKKAWTLVDAVNKLAKKEVVQKITGGRSGGGASITPYGKKLIDAFDNINQNCWIFLDKELKVLEKL
ncbi:winged helix-turn-helix domain-containing protein [Spongiivirga sp. MCCC 1A20706]|uniref:winged helix-turn-helix domain-containing protein n=1 Tax=Spongiivirga sp. MCCC 1A20706 TaxID=3160963 RepID=UPI0039776ABD